MTSEKADRRAKRVRLGPDEAVQVQEKLFLQAKQCKKSRRRRRQARLA